MKAKNEARYIPAYFRFFLFSCFVKVFENVNIDYFNLLWEFGMKIPSKKLSKKKLEFHVSDVCRLLAI